MLSHLLSQEVRDLLNSQAKSIAFQYGIDNIQQHAHGVWIASRDGAEWDDGKGNDASQAVMAWYNHNILGPADGPLMCLHMR